MNWFIDLIIGLCCLSAALKIKGPLLFRGVLGLIGALVTFAGVAGMLGDGRFWALFGVALAVFAAFLLYKRQVAQRKKAKEEELWRRRFPQAPASPDGARRPRH
jgi:membrane protein implicated in regulation of membrane protease activity